MPRRHARTIQLAGAMVLGTCLAGTPALAQTTPDTKAALKCQTGEAKTTAKFVGAKASCGVKCLATQRKAGMPDYTRCQPPGYTDPATNACIFDATKGAQAKALASIGKGCVKDCPRCFADDIPSNCPDGAGFIATAGTNVDIVEPQVFCLEAHGMTPTKQQAKCEDGVAKALLKYVGSFVKCIASCVTNEFDGKIPAGSCIATGPADAKTAACIAKADGKTDASIDEVCVMVAGNPPCYPPPLDSGAGWRGVVEGILAGGAPNSYCGSTSGTFLD